MLNEKLKKISETTSPELYSFLAHKKIPHTPLNIDIYDRNEKEPSVDWEINFYFAINQTAIRIGLISEFGYTLFAQFPSYGNVIIGVEDKPEDLLPAFKKFVQKELLRTSFSGRDLFFTDYIVDAIQGLIKKSENRSISSEKIVSVLSEKLDITKIDELEIFLFNYIVVETPNFYKNIIQNIELRNLGDTSKHPKEINIELANFLEER